jgi:hypothetical protein
LKRWMEISTGARWIGPRGLSPPKVQLIYCPWGQVGFENVADTERLN